VEIRLENPAAGFDMGGVDVTEINDILARMNLPTIQADFTAPADVDFVRISRDGFQRSAINFGGKAYIDIIPLIDAVEASVNFGVWQYDGEVKYLDVTDPANAIAAATGDSLNYSSLPVRIEDYRKSGFFGLKATPYAKLHLDLTVRKTMFKLPLDLLKLYAGGGYTLNFTTPVLSSDLVTNLKLLQDYSAEEMVAEFTNPSSQSEIGTAIVRQIIKELITPRHGMHLVAGAQAKLPLIPIALYADGKLLIPFTKFDENGEVKGMGFLVNIGAAFAF
jgi:hypothetical protein